MRNSRARRRSPPRAKPTVPMVSPRCTITVPSPSSFSGRVSRRRPAIAAAGLEPVAVELRAMACLTALGLPNQPPEGVSVGVILGDPTVTLALVEDDAVLSVQSRDARAASGGAPETGAGEEKPPPGEGPLQRWSGALDTCEQLFRLTEISHPEVASATVRAIVNEAERPGARALAERLGVTVEVVPAGSGRDLVVEARPPAGEAGATTDGEDFAARQADFAAAVGLALEGAEVLRSGVPRGRRDARPRPLNFLRAPARPRRR